MHDDENLVPNVIQLANQHRSCTGLTERVKNLEHA